MNWSPSITNLALNIPLFFVSYKLLGRTTFIYTLIGTFSFSLWYALVAKYSNLIVVRTMSKGFGMAGMRLGWGVAGPEIAALMNRVRPPNSVSEVTARVAAAALRDLDGMRAHVAAIVAEREPFAEALRSFGAHVYPSVTNFLLTRWPDVETAQQVYAGLERIPNSLLEASAAGRALVAR